MFFVLESEGYRLGLWSLSVHHQSPVLENPLSQIAGSVCGQSRSRQRNKTKYTIHHGTLNVSQDTDLLIDTSQYPRERLKCRGIHISLEGLCRECPVQEEWEETTHTLALGRVCIIEVRTNSREREGRENGSSAVLLPEWTLGPSTYSL